MLRKILLCGLLCLSACVHKAEAPAVIVDPPIVAAPERKVVLEKHITWLQPGPEVGQAAESKQRLIVLFFHDDSADSLKLKRVFQDACVIDQINEHYVAVDINAAEHQELVADLMQQGIPIPIVLFTLPSGDMIPIIVGNKLSASRYCLLLEKMNAEFQRQISGT